jgi:hypothetical protein
MSLTEKDPQRDQVM